MRLLTAISPGTAAFGDAFAALDAAPATDSTAEAPRAHRASRLRRRPGPRPRARPRLCVSFPAVQGARPLCRRQLCFVGEKRKFRGGERQSQTPECVPRSCSKSVLCSRSVPPRQEGLPAEPWDALDGREGQRPGGDRLVGAGGRAVSPQGISSVPAAGARSPAQHRPLSLVLAVPRPGPQQRRGRQEGEVAHRAHRDPREHVRASLSSLGALHSPLLSLLLGSSKLLHLSSYAPFCPPPSPQGNEPFVLRKAECPGGEEFWSLVLQRLVLCCGGGQSSLTFTGVLRGWGGGRDGKEGAGRSPEAAERWADQGRSWGLSVHIKTR